MTYNVSSGTLNHTHSLDHKRSINLILGNLVLEFATILYRPALQCELQCELANEINRYATSSLVLHFSLVNVK